MKTVEERFWEKVDRRGDNECWPWLAHCTPGGYGVIGVLRKNEYAHRVSYELSVGPIPEGLQIDHLCRNRSCVNPKHLEAVTHRENDLRGEGACAKHYRKTHCVHGHPFTEENTYRYPKGWRRCRICQKKQRRECYERKRNNKT